MPRTRKDGGFSLSFIFGLLECSYLTQAILWKESACMFEILMTFCRCLDLCCDCVRVETKSGMNLELSNSTSMHESEIELSVACGYFGLVCK